MKPDTCNAEYNESGNHDKHTHHCTREAEHAGYHICRCERRFAPIYLSGKPAKPESRCTCRHDSTHLCTNEMCDVGSHNRHHCHSQNCTAIIRCSNCLNQDAEIHRLKEDVAMNDDFVAALENKVKSLSPHETCACDYDRPGDVCAHHSPTVQRLTDALSLVGVEARTYLGEMELLTREVERLTQELVLREAELEQKMTPQTQLLSYVLKVAVEAIENAPHDTRGFGCRGIGDCNCWKAEALSSIQESGGGK